MSAPRKLWAASFPRIGGPKRRFESQRGTYRWVRNEAVPNWLAGALRSQYLTVWVDERDGQGWKRYEDIDLESWGS